MMTDTRRKKRSDPGVAEDCPVFTIHKSFSPADEQEMIKKRLFDGFNRMY